MTIRHVGVGALVLGLVVSLTGCVAGGASASCAVKEVQLGPSSLHPGGVVRLSVDWMWQTCEDGGGTSRAAEDVEVTITPAATGDAVVLAHPTPSGPRFTVSGAFDLPGDLPTGDAVLTVQSLGGDEAGASLPVTIEAEPTTTPSA
jgi:hypothetical protein